MDLLNNKQTENIFEDLDKQIKLKFLKEKKTTRTYIHGLCDFLSDIEIDQFVVDLKKKLGTGMIVKSVDDIKIYGFQGDHKERIKQILIDRGISETQILM